MRTILIILIIAAAGLAAWFMLANQNNPNETDAPNSSDATDALAAIGKNKLQEQQLQNLNAFYQEEYDLCYKACKKANCGWFERKCKGQCKANCLQQLQARYGIEPTTNPGATTGSALGNWLANNGKIVKPGKVREYNPINPA